MLLIVGYPRDGATVPAHAQVKKNLEDITTFL